jgi:glycosyltransferase involved in cell wall biosynthesis
MRNTTVVMLLDNPFLSDSRVEKEADSLINSGFEVIVYCVSDDQLPAEENRNGIVIKRILNLFFQKPFGKNYSTQLTQFSNEILKESFDILHCHDFMLMPLAAAIKKQKPRIFFTYDSHEYLAGWPYYKEIPNLINRSKGYLVWMRMLQNEKKAAKSINALLAPSAAIAKALQERFKLRFSGISVRNIPESKMIDSTISLRETLKISQDRKLIVHSGSIYMPQNFIEQLIGFVNTSANLSLVFIGNRPIHMELKQRYKAIHHIYFVDYQPNILLDQLASCDAGIIYTRSKSYKAHQLGSSNKLMEYGLAGVPTIGTQQIAHEELEEQFHHVELFSENDFASFKSAINRMIDTLPEKKKNAERIKYALSWENEFRPVIELYKKVSARLHKD